jgi:hypothetical protein
VSSAAPAAESPESLACSSKEKELRLKESDLCTGIKYLLNPSACFSTRKLLKEYDEGKCRTVRPHDKPIGREQAEKKTPAMSEPQPTGPSTGPAVSPLTAAPVPASSASTEKPLGETEKLRIENERFRAENERLKDELERLRKSTGK